MSVGNETVIAMTVILGYARVSTTGEDLDAQLTALIAAGVDTDRVFTDKLSGSAKTGRPRLAAMLDYARAGDVVVVTAIDRLGRSVAEVTRTIAGRIARIPPHATVTGHQALQAHRRSARTALPPCRHR